VSDWSSGQGTSSDYTSGSEYTTDSDYGSEYTTGSDYTSGSDYGSDYTTSSDYGSEYTTGSDSETDGAANIPINISDFPNLEFLSSVSSGEQWLSAVGVDHSGLLTGCDQQKMAAVGAVIAAAGSVAAIAFGGLPGVIIGAAVLLGSCFALAAALDALADCLEEGGDSSTAGVLRANSAAIGSETSVLESMVPA